MDKLENYRLYIQKLLEKHSHFKSQDDIQSELIFDTVRDRYQLMCIGWKGLKRVYHIRHEKLVIKSALPA
ncbi:element excision factor XisI family protein [Pseudanabaena sp. 'Roaring Creek']|uniref:element excision factor XisI family protein n=1 Tax=Pseudanabaena sp. 'Roaring Creek' TaxID=1681830 RepID=UPI0009E67E84|nr:element excision factor XisI family protein [Pseudanabaena sp. 'Roaring Creek']